MILNVIFPLFVIKYVFPPALVTVLLLNLIIDSAIIHFAFKKLNVELRRRKKIALIVIAWVIGNLLDLCGIFLLFFIDYKINRGDRNLIDIYSIYTSFTSPAIFIGVTLLVGLFIALFNYIVYRLFKVDRRSSLIVCIIMGVITAPWTYLVPTSILEIFGR